MTVKIRCDIGEGPYEVPVTLVAIVAFERKFKTALSEMKSVEHTAYLAYEASKHGGIKVPATFDDFLRKCEQMPEMVDPDPARPTDGELSADH